MTIFGLFDDASKHQVPLKQIDVKALITGFIASLETKLVYKNTTDDAIEARFTFPIDDGSAVYRFEVFTDGKHIVGECQDKDQARETYNDAVKSGDTAFLMEEKGDTGDIFECTVGNLPAQAEAVVTFSYVTKCDVLGSVVSLVYPCVLAPRYSSTAVDVPSTSSATTPAVAAGAQSEPAKWSTLLADQLPYKANAEIHVTCREPQSIHDVQVNAAVDKKSSFTKDLSAMLVLSKSFRLDQDLRVDVTYADIFKPTIYAEPGDVTRTGMLTSDVAMVQFRPELEKQAKSLDTRGEYVFIIDRSGSMHGDRIENARRSLLKCIDLLPPDCYFNVISFGSNMTKLFNSSKKLVGCSEKRSDVTVKRAQQRVKNMYADMGGTEMMAPFEWLYKQPLIDQYPRQVILLTDGAFGDRDLLQKLVRENNKTTRVFVMGIGFGASTSLVKGLSRAGRGRWEFMREDMHKLSKQVEMLLSCAMSPAMLDVDVTWTTPKNHSVFMIPSELPPVFLNQTLTFYVLISLKKKASASRQQQLSDFSVTLSGTGAKPVTLTADFSHLHSSNSSSKARAIPSSSSAGGSGGGADVDSDMPVHRMAAKAYIKELQDDEESHGTKKQSIMLVSRAANIMSRYTSFVAVNRRQDKVKGQVKQVDIPVAHRPAVAAPTPGALYGGGGKMCARAAFPGGKAPRHLVGAGGGARGRICGKAPPWANKNRKICGRAPPMSMLAGRKASPMSKIAARKVPPTSKIAARKAPPTSKIAARKAPPTSKIAARKAPPTSKIAARKAPPTSKIAARKAPLPKNKPLGRAASDPKYKPLGRATRDPKSKPRGRAAVVSKTSAGGKRGRKRLRGNDESDDGDDEAVSTTNADTGNKPIHTTSVEKPEIESDDDTAQSPSAQTLAARGRKRSPKRGHTGWSKRRKCGSPVSPAARQWQWFACWSDGYYYPAAVVESVSNRLKLRFKDNVKRVYAASQLIATSALCPGDVIHALDGKQSYVWALLCYISEQDGNHVYKVALSDGRVVICPVQDMVLPQPTADAIKQRSTSSMPPGSKFEVVRDDQLCVTTDDVSELSVDGWISAAVVKFYVRNVLPSYIRSKLITAEQLVVLDSDLTQGQDSLQYLRVYTESCDVNSVKLFVFPVFDQVHWYVIAVKIEAEPFESKKFRGQFFTMDSYFDRRPEKETAILKKLLEQVFGERGMRLTLPAGSRALQVPAQTNECDCGVYMLLSMKHTVQEGVNFRPHLDWYTKEDGIKLRREICRTIIDRSHLE